MATVNENSFLKWFIDYKDFLIVILGTLIAATVFAYNLLFGSKKKKTEAQADDKNSKSSATKNNASTPPDNSSALDDQLNQVDDKLKLNTHVLFIDDEKFPVVNILKNAGWVNTSRLRSVKSVYDVPIKNAQILFVDINGVAKELFPSDHGLGLVVALKKTYGKTKKVVIYSAETSGNRFHQAFRVCDDQLEKNADSYEFQTTAERLAIQLRNGE